MLLTGLVVQSCAAAGEMALLVGDIGGGSGGGEGGAARLVNLSTLRAPLRSPSLRAPRTLAAVSDAPSVMMMDEDDYWGDFGGGGVGGGGGGGGGVEREKAEVVEAVRERLTRCAMRLCVRPASTPPSAAEAAAAADEEGWTAR